MTSWSLRALLVRVCVSSGGCARFCVEPRRRHGAHAHVSLIPLVITCFVQLYICVVAVCHATHKQTGANPELISCLDKIQGLDVVLPTDPQYKEDTSVWELKIPQSFPLVVIVPKSASQIQSAVKCAQDAKVRVVPKSGGHSYEGYSVQTDTLAVDLINMDDVKADKKSGIVTAGAGATLGMLYYYSWFDAGMGFNAGTCPPVGVSGFMLGGGFGYYSRKAGMSCDNVVSFQMVAYDGKLLTVSKSQNKDMFWAMCGGGGGNFGIVTSWKIKMMSVPSTIQYASVTYEDSVDTAADVANYFQTWASSVDTNLGSELHVGPNNAAAKLFFYYAGSGSLSEIIDASKLSTLGSSPPKISYVQLTDWPTGWIGNQHVCRVSAVYFLHPHSHAFPCLDQ